MSNYARQIAPVVALSGAGGRTTFRLGCDQCGGKDEWTVAGNIPPNEIPPKHFRQKGWLIAKRVTCPACRKPKEKIMAAVTPIKPPPAPSADVRELRREAHALIELTFDIAAGCYKDGYSDERIANESGMPVSWVSKRREDEFGPLKVPAEFLEVKAEASELASAIGKLQAKLDAMVKRNGWAN